MAKTLAEPEVVDELFISPQGFPLQHLLNTTDPRAEAGDDVDDYDDDEDFDDEDFDDEDFDDEDEDWLDDDEDEDDDWDDDDLDDDE